MLITGNFALLLGVLLWAGAHFIPRLPVVKPAITNTLGDEPYRGIVSILILIALGLIIYGWLQARPVDLYTPPPWGYQANLILMAPALALFIGSHLPNNFVRLVRHPQLTGFLLWSVGHLLANGDSSSVILFVGLGIWAILSIVIITLRDGPYGPKEAQAFGSDIALIFVTAAVYAILLGGHRYFTGVSVFLGL